MTEKKGVSTRTPSDLVAAATLGARIATRARVAVGEDEGTIRREIIARFRRELAAESYGEHMDETLMAAVQRGIEAVLEEVAAVCPEPDEFHVASWQLECHDETRARHRHFR